MNPLAIILLAAGAYIVYNQYSQDQNKGPVQPLPPPQPQPQVQPPTEQKITSAAQIDSIVFKGPISAIKTKSPPVDVVVIFYVGADGTLKSIKSIVDGEERDPEEAQSIPAAALIAKMKKSAESKNIAEAGLSIIGPFQTVDQAVKAFTVSGQKAQK